ncbi:porin [Massilia sp. DWR3-1-1]|uniref:porin n=1 Tax=Massilia sp. DWR3-1-1 TaxID=2804559 RepID=UPI003CF14B85
MNKTLLAAAVLAACAAPALAQTNVTIYGVVDAGLVRETGGTANVTKISSGVASVSRLGFRGTEDLGGGLSALFVLETGYKTDTGEVDTAGSIFNRQALVGLKSTMGTVTLGRQYTPYYNTITTVADPFAAGLSGSAKNLLPTVGANTRTSNTVMYVSPQMSGITGELAYSAGEQADSSAGRQIGAALSYTVGKLNARLAYNNRNSDVAATTGVTAVSRDIGTNTLLAANYDFGMVKGYAAYGVDKGVNSAVLPNTSNPFGGVRPTTSTNSTDLLIGAAVPVGQGTILASVINKNDKTAFNQDATQVALGYTYALSKRTTLYTSYGKIKNRRGAGYTVGNATDAGSGDAAYNGGVRHSF